MGKSAQYTVLKIIGVEIACFGLLWIIWIGRNERENNRHINQTIYPAFRAIESECMAESNRTVRCQRVLDLLESCWGPDPCSAQEYYEALIAEGFQLPAFYEPGYQPK